MPDPRIFLCKSHPDFHIPNDVDVGVGFDADDYGRRLRDSGADAVVFFAKCHYGHSYYYTDIGFRHPRLKSDLLADVIGGCHKHGVGVIGYYSVFLDSAAIRQHPDWRLQATSGAKTDAGFDSGNFQPVCVNSPYGDELMIPQCVEVVQRYDVAEMFLDTMTGFQPCYCENCRRAFGRPIPESAADPAWMDYVRWYARQYETFFAKVAAAIRGAREGVGVTFNWEWIHRLPGTPVPGITRLAADLTAGGYMAHFVTRYAAGTGLPFDYMTGRFLHGLGDWNSNTPETLRNTAATTIANGGSFYLIDRQLPDGSLEDRAWRAMKDVFSFVQERRDWVAGTRHVPETAVLHTLASIVGPNLEFFPDMKARKDRLEPYEGVARLMMEHARHWTAHNAETLRERMDDYRTVILPETEYVDAATLGALEAWVRGGGRLLISQSGSDAAVDPKVMALAGVRYEGHGGLDYGYFDTPDPILVRLRFAHVTPLSETETVFATIRPMEAGHGGKKFGHGFSPPTVPDEWPAVTSRSLGAGEVVFVAAPVFRAYFQYQSPWLAQLLFGLFDRLLPDPLVRVTTRAQVEMAAVRQGDDLIVHLVNHSGRERYGSYFYPVIEYIPEIRDIGVSLRLPPEGMKLFAQPSGKTIPWTATPDCRAAFVVPKLEVMETIVAPGYFAQ